MPLNPKSTTITTTTADLGAKPRLDDLRALVEATADLDANSTVSINSGDSQIDGAWCIVTITSHR